MNTPDDSAIKPENMTPSELEGFIQDRADAHNWDKRIGLLDDLRSARSCM